jgi:hypothetical protein
MQLKLQNFPEVGSRLMPREAPSRLLFTGPKMISSNRKVAIISVQEWGGKDN